VIAKITYRAQSDDQETVNDKEEEITFVNADTDQAISRQVLKERESY
jgi:hypothetical protein